jgi:nucleoside 2-deoxyribosyltransferase
MNIYFACSITGGRKDELDYQKIVQSLIAAGHHVPTAELADSSVLDLEKGIDPLEVYRRDTAWIQACDALVAEISTPSHGVGYEIGYALSLGKPVICLHKKDVPVSKMILGNQDKNLSVFSYDSIEQALQDVHKHLDEKHNRP